MYSHEFDYDSVKKGCFITKPLGFGIGVIFIGTIVALITLGVLYGQKTGCKDVSEKEPPPSAEALTGASPTPTEIPTTTQVPEPVIIPNYRLPRSFKPEHYDIMIGSTLNESELTFFGKVNIHIKCIENSSLIVIHSKGLTIDYNTVKLIHWNKTISFPELQISEDNVTDFLNISFQEMLQSGENYELEIGAFKGSLVQSDLRGFYNSSYMLNNKRINLAATQFEATHARRAFPCFDEPEWKATFTVKIHRPIGMKSLCNTQLKQINPIDAVLVEEVYERSVKMSVYLVAFAISDFESMTVIYEQDIGKFVRFSSWARSNALNDVQYSLKVGVKLLKYFETTFQSNYQLNKLDMIALPDFDAGAMENWGLITYRETALLFDETRPTAVAKKRVATIVAHEILHQWFGNLVTCVWWNQIWLNEGFARYFQYESTDVAEKEWNVKDHFFVDDMQDVLEIDSLDSTHPIYQDVSTPSEIWSLFDRITYGKGGWLIRMMESFLGRENLFQGFVNYLHNNSYDVVDQEKLFNELTAASNYKIDVNLTMKSWTFEKGYPLITANRNYSSGIVTLKQERFHMRPKTNTQDQKSPLWDVYIEYKSPNEAKKGIWLTTETNDTFNPQVKDDSWLLLNVDMYGVYRVNYDKNNWKLLEQQLNSDYKLINPLNRAQILEDALTFARTGHLDYKMALDLVKYLQEEKEYVPWAAGRRGLNFLRDIISSTEHYGKFQIVMRTLSGGLYESEKDYLEKPATQALDFSKEYLASLAVNVACENNYLSCLERLKGFYKNRLNVPIPAYIFGSVYCIAVRYGQQSTWHDVFEEYKKTESAQEKVILLGALACTPDTALLNRFMDMASQENQDIKSQDVRYVFAGIARTEIGRTEFWTFLQKNWGRLKAQFKFALSSTISGALNAWVSTTSSKHSLYELNEFIQKHIDDILESQTLTNTFKQAHDKLELNVDWRDKYLQDVINWYENFLNPVTPTQIAVTTVQTTTPVTTQQPTVSTASTSASPATNTMASTRTTEENPPVNKA